MLYGVCCADASCSIGPTHANTFYWLDRQHIVRVQQDADPKDPGEWGSTLSWVGRNSKDHIDCSSVLTGAQCCCAQQV